jgi:glycosyltransferase involved in cell wall biosynthesis
MMKKSELPLITVALMVKNESIAVEATLFSLLNGGISHFFVLDTGSSDNTVQLVQEFFQKHPNIDGYISQEPFVDFAASRNRTLELAEHYFPNTVFFLMPDAEWYLHHPHALMRFCEKEQHTDTPLYLIKIKINSVEFAAARLFRASKRIRFKGVVHEAPEVPAQAKTPDPIYFEVNASHQGIEKSRQRWQRDLPLLLKAYQENNNDPRTTFYLAQTYECLGMLEKAYLFYQHRSKLNGWDEENFITLFRLGCLAQRNKINNTDAWATAMDYFLQAFSLRPHRIEPLVKIAEHYWPRNIQTCYLFIRHAYDIPYPTNDLLFIEKEMYDYHRYELLSRCAWYVDQYELGEKATLLALAVHPNMNHLHNNLKLYQEKLAFLFG